MIPHSKFAVSLATAVRLVGFSTALVIASEAQALPPLPAPYPTPLPVASLPEPVARPGSVNDLPGPLPMPLATPMPGIRELDDAGAEKPGEEKPYDALLIENTAQNRSRLQKYGDQIGVKAREEVGKYILIDVGIGRKYGADAAKFVGDALGLFERVIAIRDVYRDTGSGELAFHQFVREAFEYAGGKWITSKIPGGEKIAIVRGIEFIGTTAGGIAAEVVIHTGVALGDGARAGYDWSKSKINNAYRGFRDWWSGDDDELPPAATSQPTPTPNPQPTPPDRGDESGGGPSDPSQPSPNPAPTPTPTPNPSPTPTPPEGGDDNDTGGDGQGNDGGDDDNGAGNNGGGDGDDADDSKSGNGSSPLPPIKIHRPPGWGVGK